MRRRRPLKLTERHRQHPSAITGARSSSAAIPASVGFDEQDSFEMILDEALAGYDFPVMTGVDFGHTDPLLTFRLGVQCRMDAERGALELVEPWLS